MRLRGTVQILLTLMAGILFGILVSGCTSLTDDSTSIAATPGLHSVDPALREFYETLGGEDVLGPAISRLFPYKNRECQYMQNALLCRDPQATDVERFGFFPLGRTFQIQMDPSRKVQAGEHVVDGVPIYEEFLPLYERLYGAHYVGRPLSEVRLNYEQKRIEQYFENVGFYRRFDEPQGEVHLLAYGAFACAGDCPFTVADGSAITRLESTAALQPFFLSLERMGGLTVFGLPLSEAYTAADGNMEQVYETAVLYGPADVPGGVRLRPIARQLGMPQTEPVRPQYGEADGMVFYYVNGELGYHVPIVFDAFIASHGGREISGDPIAEVLQVGETLYRQCFENYCLDYDSSAADELRVRMAPLGRMLLSGETFSMPALGETKRAEPLDFSPETVRLQLSEARTRVRADESNRIDVLVLSAESRQPLANIEAGVVVELPDGSTYTTTLGPTDANGYAGVEIPPMNAVANGVILPYTVCLNVPSQEPICAVESYLIWNY